MKNNKDNLGNRMKGYENASRNFFTQRTPLIVRIDGKSFHTFTKKLDYFDIHFSICMQLTTEYLVKNLQNCVLGYTQSDEISLLFNDWKRHETQPLFNANQSKIESLSSSMATAAFNNIKSKKDYLKNCPEFAMFDSRSFTLPKEDVCNYFIWRQNNASRNSISMLGRKYFSHKEVQGKNVNQIQDMLMEKYSVNWHNLLPWDKRGSCVTQSGLDLDIPIFKTDRNYIEQHLEAQEE